MARVIDYGRMSKRQKKMRILLIIGAVIAVVSVNARPAAAVEAPWCALISLGPGAVYEDCQYWTFEACRPTVLAGNRGFCNPNPRYVGPVPGTKKTRHRHHVQPG